MYEKISYLAERRGETIHQMCQATGVPDATISNLKCKKRKGMSNTNLMKVAAYYGVTIEFLLIG